MHVGEHHPEAAQRDRRNPNSEARYISFEKSRHVLREPTERVLFGARQPRPGVTAPKPEEIEPYHFVVGERGQLEQGCATRKRLAALAQPLDLGGVRVPAAPYQQLARRDTSVTEPS